MKSSEEDSRQIVTEYAEVLYRIIFPFTGNRADTEDLVQEVFLSWVTGHPAFQNKEHEKAWFIRVAINKAKNYRGSGWKRLRTDYKETEHAGEDFTKQVETVGIITEQVMKLPAKYKPIIYLRFYEDLSIKEIAGLLNMNEHTVQTRLRRAKIILQKELGGIFDEGDV